MEKRCGVVSTGERCDVMTFQYRLQDREDGGAKMCTVQETDDVPVRKTNGR